MLSSRFLVVSFLYVFYAAGLVAANPQDPFGGRNQFCQSVRTVTVTQTVTPGQPTPSPRPASKSNTSSLPVLTTRPGNVNLDNGVTSSSVVKNTKTSSIKTSSKTSSSKTSTKTSSIKTSTRTSSSKTSTRTSSSKTNTKTSSIKTNTKTSSGVKNTQTSSVKTNTKTSSSSVNTITSSVSNVKTNTRVSTNTKNTKTSSTGFPTASPPPVSTTDSSLVISSSSTAAPPANTDTGNPSTSLTLDPSVIQNVDGKGQAAGETDSIVSPNNFIGFCVGKTLTNGKQVQAGSCNPTPIGDIPSVDNMPSAKFNFPKNFDTIAADTQFTISIEIRNMVLGTFTNAANTYYAAPQQLVGGVIQGHSHVTVQKMTSLDSPEPLNPKVFAFFKGLNAGTGNGVLTADLPKGLPAGVYRISSINSAGNHQEVLGPVAQRGSFNDAIYITVTEGGVVPVSSSAVPPLSSDISSSSVVNPISSSVVDPTATDLPAPSPTDRDGGDVVSSSATLPETTTPAAGNGETDTTVSSPTELPDSTPTQGANGQGGESPEGGNRQNLKRVHRRSRHA